MLITPVSVSIICSINFHGLIICSQYSYSSATNAKILFLILLLSDLRTLQLKKSDDFKISVL